MYQYKLSRQLEEAADELGRLDATCALAPRSVEIALIFLAVTGLAEPTPASFAALVAAQGDPLHDALLSPGLLAWRELMTTEERRARSGARLTVACFAFLGDQAFQKDRLEAIWRESHSSQSVIERALDSAAWSPSRAVGEASAALLLCGGGRTDRVRILPFAERVADDDVAERSAALLAYREGQSGEWTALALGALATRARAAQLAVKKVIDAPAREDESLRPLGRAAITARDVLALLRQRLSATIPSLAEALGLSRPAANDAVERLVMLALAREVTGRARDRVFAYEAPCAMAESLLDAATDSSIDVISSRIDRPRSRA